MEKAVNVERSGLSRPASRSDRVDAARRNRKITTDEFAMITALKLLISVTIPLAVGGISGIASARGVRDWYSTLATPPFNPPSWVFAPVWTALYVAMGVAAFLVWQKGWSDETVRVALACFVVQLVLNGLWSVLFFGLQSPGWALVDIVLLWLSIALAVVLFWRVLPAAGVIMLPYLAWVSFAAVLNGSIWVLNR
jgi:benzodiazapine receptor